MGNIDDEIKKVQDAAAKKVAARKSRRSREGVFNYSSGLPPVAAERRWLRSEYDVDDYLEFG